MSSLSDVCSCSVELSGPLALEHRESERQRERLSLFCGGEVWRNMKSITCVNKGLCMCLMLCASPGKGLNIQYHKNKKHMFERINGASVPFFPEVL